MNSIDGYNPDVLTCLANLSSDEVFTPPEVVNVMLDALPVDLWKDRNSRFLEPCSKSGVFLREITKRLINGLEEEIPDKQVRLNHILTHQVFGYATTELTSLVSRRSLYCSKYANGKYSICDEFGDEQGNLFYVNSQHTWNKGSCIHCGAREAVFSRGEGAENYAYAFIHENIQEIKEMKFDVIIGNPPYQLDDGGHGASAAPIYHKFVQQALKLNPRFVTMIIPSRWFTGGRVGDLYDFREQMLKDKRIRVLHDFVKSKDVFPGVEIKGGVNYFLWDRDNPGKCRVTSHAGDGATSSADRYLLEDGMDTFVRANEAIPIIKKVKKLLEPSFDSLISANDPFGFDVRQQNSMKRVKVKYSSESFSGSLPYYYNGWKKNGLGFVDRKLVRKNEQFINGLKLLVPKAIGSGETSGDVIKPIVPNLGSCCSETYLVVGLFKTEDEVSNALSYIKTKFFHFLVGVLKNTQEARRNVYALVPLQDFSNPWDDDKLYDKYRLSSAEIEYIENIVPSAVRD